MIVLGFDTATPATVVGLSSADGTLLRARDDPQPGQRPGHSTRLLPFANELLSDAGLGWRQIERIAVGVGPGTFTGLRIGIATARALAQSLGVELVGVSSLHALAYEDREHAHALAYEDRDHAHGEAAEVATVLAVIDARRGEVFVAGYHGEKELLAPHAVSPDRMGGLLEGAEIHTGSGQWVAVGDGAVRYRDAFERLGVSVPPEGSERHRIQASAICGLGSRLSAGSPAASFSDSLGGPAGGAPVGAKAIVPDYLRRPDAEIALEGVA